MFNLYVFYASTINDCTNLIIAKNLFVLNPHALVLIIPLLKHARPCVVHMIDKNFIKDIAFIYDTSYDTSYNTVNNYLKSLNAHFIF